MLTPVMPPDIGTDLTDLTDLTDFIEVPMELAGEGRSPSDLPEQPGEPVSPTPGDRGFPGLPTDDFPGRTRIGNETSIDPEGDPDDERTRGQGPPD
jgi:hypothetical protein